MAGCGGGPSGCRWGAWGEGHARDLCAPLPSTRGSLLPRRRGQVGERRGWNPRGMSSLCDLLSGGDRAPCHLGGDSLPGSCPCPLPARRTGRGSARKENKSPTGPQRPLQQGCRVRDPPTADLTAVATAVPPVHKGAEKQVCRILKVTGLEPRSEGGASPWPPKGGGCGHCRLGAPPGAVGAASFDQQGGVHTPRNGL